MFKKAFTLFLTISFFFVTTGISQAVAAEPQKAPISAVEKKESVFDLTQYIDVTKTQNPLKSRLNKEYVGYTFVVNSSYNKTLNLLNGQIIDGINGQQAYLQVEKDPMATWFWFGLIGYYITSKKNKTAKIESAGYTNEISAGIINPGDTIKFNSLIPIGQNSQIKLIFQDPVSQSLYTVIK